MKNSEKIASIKTSSSSDSSLWYLYAALEPEKWLKCYTDLISLNNRRKYFYSKKNYNDVRPLKEVLAGGK